MEVIPEQSYRAPTSILARHEHTIQFFWPFLYTGAYEASERSTPCGLSQTDDLGEHKVRLFEQVPVLLRVGIRPSAFKYGHKNSRQTTPTI